MNRETFYTRGRRSNELQYCSLINAKNNPNLFLQELHKKKTCRRILQVFSCARKTCRILVHVIFWCKSCRILLFYFIVNGGTT